MRKTVLAALVLAATTVAGCPRAQGPVRVQRASQAPAEEWRQVVADHTRRDVDYQWLVRQADLRATLFTPRLRAAYADNRERFRGAFAREMAMELVALGRKPDEGVDAPMQTGPTAEEEVLVFVAMYVTDRKNRDLAASYTIWDKELRKGEARAKPKAIETVRYSPAVVDMFPFIDGFDDLYLLRFPLVDPATGVSFLSPEGPPLELAVTSALADCTVAWDLVE